MIPPVLWQVVMRRQQESGMEWPGGELLLLYGKTENRFEVTLNWK